MSKVKIPTLSRKSREGWGTQRAGAKINVKTWTDRSVRPTRSSLTFVLHRLSNLVQDAGLGDLAHFFERDAAVGDVE